MITIAHNSGVIQHRGHTHGNMFIGLGKEVGGARSWWSEIPPLIPPTSCTAPPTSSCKEYMGKYQYIEILRYVISSDFPSLLHTLQTGLLAYGSWLYGHLALALSSRMCMGTPPAFSSTAHQGWSSQSVWY